MPNDANDAKDLDPEQVRKNSDESVEKKRSLTNELRILQEYENAIMTGEDQPSWLEQSTIQAVATRSAFWSKSRRETE